MTITPKVQDWLRVEMIDDEHWRLVSEFRYDSAVASARFIVQAGYVTDFASVPRLPLAYLLTGNTAHAAAVIHDYLYGTGVLFTDERSSEDAKALSDSVFREVMEVTGLPAWRRFLLYQGVNLGGQRRWDFYRAGGVR